MNSHRDGSHSVRRGCPAVWLVLWIGLLPGSQALAGPVPESPTNDTFSGATVLPLTQFVVPSGFHVGHGEGAIHPAGDVDYWLFSALVGDRVAVALDMPDPATSPQAALYDATTNLLAADNISGPGKGAYISHFVIPTDGDYFVKATAGSSTGAYHLRVEVARGLQLETDAGYANDTLAGANSLAWTPGAPTRRAAIAGTVMGSEGDNFDEDLLALGMLNGGVTIELILHSSSNSTLLPFLTLLNAEGNLVMNSVSQTLHHSLQTVVPSNGCYYALVSSYLPFGPSFYLPGLLNSGSRSWLEHEADAVRLGGHLASVGGAAEQDWLAATFGPFSMFWIGFHNLSNATQYAWSSGESVNFTNWLASPPTNGAYATLSRGAGMPWLANPVTGAFRAVMEWPGVAGPGTSGPGPEAQYLLEAAVHDTVPPTVVAMEPLATGGLTCSLALGSFRVDFDEALLPLTVNPPSSFRYGLFGGHTYLVDRTSRLWSAAEAEAQRWGGHLVSLHSAAENEWVRTNLIAESAYWIGLNDVATEGVFRWSSGEPVTYLNWRAGQPGSLATDYDYVYLQTDGRWSTRFNFQPLPGLFEFDTDSDVDGDGAPDVLDNAPRDPRNGWQLYQAGPDGLFETADDVQYRLFAAPLYSGGTTATVVVADGPLADGRYRFRALPTLADLSFNALDGDGDGIGGNDFVREFVVALPAGFVLEGRTNGTLDTATALPLTEDPPGSGLFLGRGLGTIDVVEDLDYWRFEAQAGDVVSICADTPFSDLNSDVALKSVSRTLYSDADSGPGYDAFLSHYTIQSNGTYYVEVSGPAGGGEYRLRVELARGTHLESDRDYSNETASTADVLTLTTNGMQRSATAAGTIMDPQVAETDEDCFRLGAVAAGESILLNAQVPQLGTLRPLLEVRNAANQTIATYPNPSPAGVRADITVAGTYHAVVRAQSGQGYLGQYLLEAVIRPTSGLAFADLAVATISAPTNANSRATVPFAWTVGNYGATTTPVSAWVDRLYLSADDSLGSGDDVLLAEVSHAGTLATNATYTVQTNLTLPDGVAGRFTVWVVTDAAGTVPEHIFEGNNARAVSAPFDITRPPWGDLSLSGVTAPAIGVAAQPLVIQWTVINQGPDRTGDGTPGGVVTAWEDRVVFSRNTVLGDGDDVTIGEVPHTGALLPGSGYQGSSRLPLPANLSGSYRVFVVCDATDQVDEFTNAAPNVAISAGAVTVAPAPFADLEVAGVTAPATASLGEKIPVSWEARNRREAWANTPTSSWFDRIILSTNAVAGDGDDRILASVRHQGALALGASYVADHEVSIPAGVEGPLHLFVMADALNAVYEFAFETNNLSVAASVLVQRPDLAVGVLNAPASATVGASTTVEWSVANLGPGAALHDWSDRLSISTNATLDAAAIPLATVSVAAASPLAAGTNYSRADSVTLPNHMAAGAYFLHVAADALGHQPEVNEGNNSRGVPITVQLPPWPDLVVRTLVAPTNVEAGEAVEIRWTITNETDFAAHGPWLETLALSSDDQPGDDEVVDVFRIEGGLGPHESAERVRTVAVRGSLAGQRWFVVTVDSQDQVAEIGLAANNAGVAAMPSTVLAADLVVEDFAFPAGALYGQTVDLAWTVRNLGTATARADWRETLGWSGPGVASETFLQVDRLATLPPGASYRRTNSVRFPLHAGLAPGQVSLTLHVDSSNRQIESNEGNNRTNTPPLSFGLPALPDLAVLTMAAPATLLPGESAAVSWVVTNRGASAATAPWTERLLLAAETNSGAGRILATIQRTNDLPAGASLATTQTVAIPGGLFGGKWLVAQVDPLEHVVEASESNNQGALPVTIPAALRLALNRQSIPENAATNALMATLSRNIGIETNLVVSLSTSDPSEATVAPTITLPAGEAFVSFGVAPVRDEFTDGAQPVTLSASAPGFVSAAAPFTVTDGDVEQLTLQVVTPLPEGAGSFGIVSRNSRTNEAQWVSLWSEYPYWLRLETNRVVIPAGQTATTFSMLAVENDYFQGPFNVRVYAVASNYAPASASLEITDNDAVQLSLAVADLVIAEGTRATGPMTTGIVTRTPVTMSPLTVSFLVEGDARLVRPPRVLIPAGQASAPFYTLCEEDDLVNTNQLARLTARIHNERGDLMPTGSASLEFQLIDNDGPSLRVSRSATMVREGNPLTGTVWRNTTPTSELTISLASSDLTEATVPASVTIPAGQVSAPFTITALNDGVTDGVQAVTILAEAAGYHAARAQVHVSDMDLPDLVVTTVEAPTNALTGETVAVTWCVTNQGLAAVTGSWVDELWTTCRGGCGGGGDRLVTSLTFTGTLGVGEGYTRSTVVTLPAEPGTLRFSVKTDADKSVAEGVEENNLVGMALHVSLQPAYRALAWTEVETVPNGTPIPIQGRAWHARDTNLPAAFKPVKVEVVVKRMTRTLNVTTDASGAFQAVFTPLPDEAGDYTLGADFPQKAAAPAQDQFTIHGLDAQPAKLDLRLVPQTPINGVITLANLGDLPLSGVNAAVLDAPAAVQVELAVSNQIPANASVSLAYSITATGTAAADYAFILRVTSAQGASRDVPVTIRLVPLRPELAATPAYLERGMVRGQQALVSIELANLGGAPTGPLSVSVPEAPWLSLVSTRDLASLAPGDKTMVTLRLAPPDDLPLTRHDGTLVVNGAGLTRTIPFQFRALSTGLADLRVRVEDQYTYYVEGAPLVTNASVTLVDPFSNTIVATTNTFPSGEAVFVNLPEGFYTLEVLAERHTPYRGTLTLQPGILNEARALLARETVTYTWKVVPTELADHYRIVLEAEFETEVPVPNVVVEEPLVFEIVVPGEETQLDIGLRNEGLIAAHDVRLPQTYHPYYEVVPLVSRISVLPAKSRMSIPAILRLRDSQSSGQGGHAPKSLQPCPKDNDCSLAFIQPVVYYYQCGPDGFPERRSIDIQPLCREKEQNEGGSDPCLKNAKDWLKAAREAKGGGLPFPCSEANDFMDCMGANPPPCANCARKNACSILSGDGPTPDGDCLECLCRVGEKFLPFFDRMMNEDVDTLPSQSGGGSGSLGGGFTFAGVRDDCFGGGGGGGGGGGQQSPRDKGPKDPASGVCARVRLRLEQDGVMTRAAFTATLAVDNAGDVPLTGVRVDLDFRDGFGNSAAEYFAVRGPECVGLTAVDGSGQVPAGSVGVARYTFVPSLAAAVDAPTAYHVGGTLRYFDSGEEVVVALLPSSLFVLPEARLALHYFHERNVFGDDPFTPDLEPAQPFALGLIARNAGAGMVRNFRITSAQPRIVENQKGLLNDFKILATQVGSNAALPSLTATLGNIPAGGLQVARWLLTSSLQGQFMDYSAAFEHVDLFGNTNFSLIESVAIHELIHSVQADRPGDDAVPDFLVNDDADPEGEPDRLYLSDGTVAVVNPGSHASVDGEAVGGDLQVRLTAAMPGGWAYLKLPDPGWRFVLHRAVRSDGKELRVGDNVWQTDRTFPSAASGAVREWLLHLLDFNGPGDYTLHYRVNDTESPTLLEVVSPSPALQAGPVAAVEVVFSEPIDLSTFTGEDLALTLNGGPNLIGSHVTVTLVANATYRINGLASLTVADGNYELTVRAEDIRDYGGNAVANSGAARWAKGEHAPVVVSVGPVLPKERHTPVASVDVVFSRPINPDSFWWSDLTLGTPAGGNGANPGISITPLSDTAFRVGGLDAFTATEGQYALTVYAAGVEDLAGNAGVGQSRDAWRLDRTGPQVVGLEEVVTPRSTVVSALEVTFSEPIDPASFDWQDLTLRRHDGLNLINTDVIVTPLSATSFRVANLNWMVGHEGVYTLMVYAPGVQDLAGNSGLGVGIRSWTMDTTAPAMPFDVHVSPDTGASAADGWVNTNRFSILGRVSETNVTVRIHDTTANHDLGDASVAQGDFARAVELTGAGKHRLRLRAVDEAGNTSTNAFFDVFVDVSPPVVTLDAITPNPRTNAVSIVTARCSEAVDTNAFTWSALTLTRNGGANLIQSNTVSLRLTASNVVQITGLAGLTAEIGDYELILWPTGIVDLAGNAAALPATNTWQRVGQNTAPRLSPIPLQAVTEEAWVSLVFNATDADLPPQQLTFSLDGPVPAGVSLNASSGLFRWRPTEAQGPGSYVFTARVRDNGLPPLSDTKEFTVQVLEDNQPPTIPLIPEQLIFESFTLSLPIRATDADLPPNLLHFVLASNAPAGLTLGLLDGLLTWTPTEAQCDTTNQLTVLVSDNGTPNLTAARTITVVARCLKPGLNLPRRAPAGGWEFTFKGEVGHDYRIETSDDLREWHPLFPITATNRIFTVADPDPIPRLYRYYRAVQQ